MKKKGHNYWRTRYKNSFLKGTLSAIQVDFAYKKFQTAPSSNIFGVKCFKDGNTKSTLPKNIETSKLALRNLRWTLKGAKDNLIG